MSKTIDYYFPPHRPWTYLGHARFAAIAAAAGATVRVRPVDMGSIFPVSGGLPLGKRAPQRQAYRLVDSHMWNKLSVVRCGLELDQLPQVQHGAGARTRLILVGRLSGEKGIAGLLEALAMLAPTQRPDLAIVGDGPLRAELDIMVARLGLGEVVTFLGRLPEAETRAAIADSDALVLPSFMEGLPIVLMEAMALGKPVIATRVAGIPELVRDGQNGLLFTPSDWPELADKIAALTADDALRQQFGTAGKETIAAEFDIRQSAARLLRLFDQAARSDSSFSAPPIAPVSDTSGSSTTGRAAAEPVPRS